MKKVFAQVLTTLVVTLLCVFGVQAQFSGGSGTQPDPWQISSAEDLDQIRNYLDGHFHQIADIDLGVSPWNVEEGWEPIGESGTGNQFTGSYNGDGYSIINLTINRPETYRQGLFGEISNARLTNVHLVNVDVLGFHYAGGLAGNINESVVEHSGVTGQVLSEKSYVGGLAGSASRNSRFQYVYVDVTVKGDGSVGGLLGSASSIIRHAWSAGQVEGNGSRIGGLVGSYNAGSGTISDSYSHASVTGERFVGGFVGYKQTGTIHRSFSTGAVSGTGESDDDIGGFLGFHYSGSDSYCYWDTQTSGQAESAGREGIVGRSTMEMQQSENFKGFNFYTLWSMTPGQNYPVFQDLSGYSRPAELLLSDLQGVGTEANPYIITNADELNVMRLDLEAHYRLGDDIDLTAALVWNNGDGWEPIGTSGTDQAFTGHLDGNGYVIHNLTVNRPNERLQGLFGQINAAKLENIRLESVQVHGAGDTGGLAGKMTGGSVIENSSVSGQIVSYNNSVGGLVGSGDRSLVHRVHADVQVWGDGSVGGLFGVASINLKIRHAWSAGHVEAIGSRVGGLIGHFNGSSKSISDSYSHASVTGERYVGGFVGHKQTGTIHRSFSTGAVSGTGEGDEDIGGFLGYHYSGNESYCYWDKQTSGQAESAGREGVIGLTTSQMQEPENFRGYNFFTLWSMLPQQDYPAFQDLSGYSRPAELLLSDLQGAGTEANPYIITSADELNVMRLDLEAHYRLGNDIDLSPTVVWNYGDGWEAIGDAGSGNHFSGSLDGNGYVIRNLTVNRPVTSRQGLFSEIGDAILENILLEDVQVHGGYYVGGIAGISVSGSEIHNSSVTGEIVSNVNYVGGLAGSANRGLMHRVFAIVDVWSGGISGGLAGGASIDQEIHYAWTQGNVISTGSHAGGLVGHYNGSSKSIIDSYSRSVVRGERRVGGFIGFHQTGNIHNSYSAGRVTLTGDMNDNIGGFIGEDYYGSVFNSYWDMESSGQTESFGGERLQGKPTEDMTWPYDEGSFAGWDFMDVWVPDSEGINNGYPYLKGMARASHEIMVYAEQQEGGIVEGGGVFRHGDKVMLTARANEGWVFLHWSEAGVLISESPSYTFTATLDRSLSAHFEEPVPTDTEWQTQLPREISLSQSYPNPFNPVTQIPFALPEEADVRLEVFNVMGQRVALLVSERRAAGYHTVRFDAAGLASGVYIKRLIVSGSAGSGYSPQVYTRTMTFVK